MELLTRDKFRESVFERDNHKCVVCGKTENLDAHHIIERRLWNDGGYYIDNGATLCDVHHMEAEKTNLSVEQIRQCAKIERIVLPENMYHDVIYDKWGNTILSNGTRSKGALFDDISVQRILASILFLFTDYVKYPRTYHLPWSEGFNDDDRRMKDVFHFYDKEIVVTRKMDGENFSGYNNYCHARAIESGNHYTRNWVKNFWMQRAYNLPKGWRICAENLYATHSIHYNNLESYLLGFSIWDNRNICLSWKDTTEWFELLEMKTVPVLYEGIYDEIILKNLYDSKKDYDKHEGYVVRLANEFHYSQFNKSVAKFVRPNHIQTTKHWMYGYRQTHELNELKNDNCLYNIKP